MSKSTPPQIEGGFRLRGPDFLFWTPCGRRQSAHITQSVEKENELLQQHHLFDIEISAGIYHIEVDSTGHFHAFTITPIPAHHLVTSVFVLVKQHFDLLSQDIVNDKLHLTILGQCIPYDGLWIERIGVVLG